MKKKFIPLALVLLLVCLAGCSKTPAEKPQLQETTPASGPVPSEPTTPAETHQPQNTVETTTATTAPTEAPSDSTTPTEPSPTTPAPTAPATEPAATPTEQKPVTPPTIPPTEPKPTESTKPTESKPTEPTTQPTEPPTEVPTQPAAGVTEADFPALKEYARNYASSLGFYVDRSLSYGNAGYYPATYVSNVSLDAAKKDIRESVQSLKAQLLARDTTSEEFFDGTKIGYNCDLFVSDMGSINIYDFYG